MDTGHLVLSFALVLLLGTTAGKLCKLLRLPSVTGYLLVGILFGPYLLGNVSVNGISLGFSAKFIGSVKIIYTIAFSFICFSLGEETKPRKLKAIGQKAVVIALIQSLASVVLAGGALALFAIFTDEKYITLSAALVLGALAAASAPTAKYMIARQYKTEGEITDMMVPIVALDDIFGIIIFAVVMAVVPALDGGAVSVFSLLLSPLIEVVLSCFIGVALGTVLGFITKVYKIEGARIVICIGFVLLAVALSEIVEAQHIYLFKNASGHGEGHIVLSPLLLSIMMGGAFSFVNHGHGIRKKLDAWTFPMFVVFFVLAGANIDITGFASIAVLLVGAIYLVFRFGGKYYGTYLGAKLTRQSPNMQKYLGITLLPQADIALILAALAVQYFADVEGKLILSVICLAAIVFEVLGHVLIRIALRKAGEIHGDTDEEIMAEEEDEYEKTIYIKGKRL